MEMGLVSNPNQRLVIQIFLLIFRETEGENWFKSFFMIRETKKNCQSRSYDFLLNKDSWITDESDISDLRQALQRDAKIGGLTDGIVRFWNKILFSEGHP